MTPVPNEAFLERFRAALRLEIKAEMGRQSLSPHALAQELGQNPQYVNMRLLTPNKKTGRFVDINVPDLTAIAGALGVDPADLMRLATEAAAKGDVALLEERRGRRPVVAVQDEAARESDEG